MTTVSYKPGTRENSEGDRWVGNLSMYINGEWVKSADGAVIESEDPSTGRTIGTVPQGSATDVDLAVAAAEQAQRSWAATPAMVRGMLLRKVAALVTENAEELARVEALDAGHYLSKARQLVGGVSMWLDYHAGLADKVGGRSIPVPGGQLDFTVLEPLGVTAHILPWNYPMVLVVRSVAPALAMGNTVVVKPAEQTPLGALKLAELFHQAGFPPGVVNVVTGYGDVGAALSEHPQVSGVTFTGSVETGQKVAHAAVDRMATVNLELGGKSPHIVFPDARIDDAVEAAMQAIFSHAGQVCLAGSRLFLHDDIHDEFMEKFLRRVDTVKVGDVMDPQTNMGPLISEEQLSQVLNYVEIGKGEGARLVAGGKRVDRAGYFVEPTVFVDTNNSMRICQEEIFGPIVAVERWTDVDDVIARANDSKFGLYAGVWSQDIDNALGVARRIESGSVAVNDWWGEVPQAPYGGYKQSGGSAREDGIESIHGYTRIKNIAINTSGRLFGSDGLPSDWAEANL